MTLLGGYDFALDVGQPMLQDMLRASLEFDGRRIYPPAEITRTLIIDLQGFRVAAQFHCIITSISVDIGNPAGESVLVAGLDFHEASVVGGPLSICPLDGLIILKIPVYLADAGGGFRSVFLGLSTVSAELQLSNKSKATLDGLGLPVPTDRLVSQMQTEIAKMVRAAADMSVPQVKFMSVSGQNGALGPPLQLLDGNAICLYDPAPEKQCLCLLGNLLVGNAGSGNPSSKSFHGIPAGRAWAISLSPGAFEIFVICPSIETVLSVPPGGLPPTCGGAQSFDVSGVNLTRIATSIVPDAVLVSLSFTKDGFCYTAKGSVTATLTVSSSPGGISWAVTLGSPSVDVTIPWYCYAASFLINPILGVLLGIADALADEIVAGELNNLSSSLGATGRISVIPSADSAMITPEAFTLAGTVKIATPESDKAAVFLNFSKNVLQTEVVASGTRQSPRCPEAPITWSEVRLWQTAILIIEARLFGLPISTSWSLAGSSGPPVSLVGAQGTAQVTVDASFENVSGITHVTRTASVRWQISSQGRHLELFNDPNDGTYALKVYAQLSNCSTSLNRGLQADVFFEGHILQTLAAKDLLHACLMRELEKYGIVDIPRLERKPWFAAEEMATTLSAYDRPKQLPPPLRELMDVITMVLPEEMRRSARLAPQLPRVPFRGLERSAPARKVGPRRRRRSDADR